MGPLNHSENAPEEGPAKGSDENSEKHSEVTSEKAPEKTTAASPEKTSEKAPEKNPEKPPEKTGEAAAKKPSDKAGPKAATRKIPKWLTRSVVAVLVVALGVFLWTRGHPRDEYAGLAYGNGRMEATEIDINAKFAGRVEQLLVREGDLVEVGQVVARVDTAALAAQQREAEAKVREAASNVASARHELALRQAERANAVATLTEREADLDNARKHLRRSSFLAERRAASVEEADDDRTEVVTGRAKVSAVRAQVAQAAAAVAAAQAEVSVAESNVAAANANVQRLRADIAQSMLRSPRYGRVQYKVAERGEVVGEGGRVLNMIDLRDVYMTFFLPTVQAGKVVIGAEARIVLDAMPQYVIPARISFVSDVAQFTPKTVETKTEREKLMFRLRARIPFELLQRRLPNIKTGLPGTAYVRVDSGVPWPAKLQVKLPAPATAQVKQPR